ncbi:MAG TPA: hypothetical protein VK435_11180 [Thermodesulfovibrionales bacterium]|nr:hypothetical protein [Thermodesulfovibrionales bacterium]
MCGLVRIAIVSVVLLFLPMMIYAQEEANQGIVALNPSMSDSNCIPKHSFIVTVREQISSILSKIKSKITGSGGTFDGNAESGSFAGRSRLGTIKGGYRSISDNEIEITIEDKPFLVPYSAIESEIKKSLI